MKQLLLKRSPLLLLIMALLLGLLAAAGQGYRLLQQEKRERLGRDNAYIAWQYSQLQGEFHRFGHQLDRALLLFPHPAETHSLRLRRAVLQDHFNSARALSDGEGGSLSRESSPFVELDAFLRNSAHVVQPSYVPRRDDLSGLRHQLDVLQDKMTMLSVVASRLSAEASVQNRIVANRLEDSLLMVLGLLVPLGVAVVGAILHGLMAQARLETRYRTRLRETETTLSRASVLSRHRNHLLKEALEQIRTPLNTLRGVVAAPLPCAQTAPVLAAHTHKTLNLIQSSIEDTLDFAQLNIGCLPVNKSVVPLPTLIEDTLRQCQEYAQDKEVQCQCSNRERLPDACETDAEILRKILR